MASAIRSAFALRAVFKQLPKKTSFRALQLQSRSLHHQSPHKAQSSNLFNKAKPTASTTTSSIVQRSRDAFRRAYSQQTTSFPNPAGTGNLSQRLLYGAAIFGGTLIVTNLVFNRETREDGGMPPFERAYLNETFMHTGLGIGIIAVAARALHQSGWSVRLMASNPWLVMGGGLVVSIGTMYGCMATLPDNYIQKYALWAGFNVTQAALLSPLLFFSPALLARAGLYTVAMMGSIAVVGATAKTDKYLYLGGPLLAGVAIVAVSGFAPLVLPATAARTLAVTENIWLWGGLAVFGGFTLYDVQKILHHARLAERGLARRDAVNESISLELDFINIFVRMVQILGMSQRRK